MNGILTSVPLPSLSSLRRTFFSFFLGGGLRADVGGSAADLHPGIIPRMHSTALIWWPLDHSLQTGGHGSLERGMLWKKTVPVSMTLEDIIVPLMGSIGLQISRGLVYMDKFICITRAHLTPLVCRYPHSHPRLGLSAPSSWSQFCCSSFLAPTSATGHRGGRGRGD